MQIPKRFSDDRGFTLLETLVALAILAIALAAVIRVYREPLLKTAAEWIAELEAHPSDYADLRPQLLAVANRRFVSLSDVPNWFNMREGQITETRPAVFEGVSYNLAYPVKLEWLRLRDKKHAQ